MSTPAISVDLPAFGGLGDVLNWANRLDRRASRTALDRTTVTANVAEVLVAWDGELALRAPVRCFPNTATDAVGFIATTLGIPQGDVLSAVGIPSRTYFGWKTGHQPRSRNLRKLWQMTEVIYYMVGAHPNLAAWFSSDKSAQKLFATGDANGLALLEFSWAINTYHAPPRSFAESDNYSIPTFGEDRPRRRRISDTPQPVRRREPKRASDKR